ncbi:MAG: hypothetical protein J5I53_08880 [Bradyrhizobiaceae bacterium]|nr:hypothetical protein [Bradyrhizobiaceae bacterium]
MTNYTQGNPHLWITDDPAMFFGSELNVALAWDQWDNGIVIEESDGQRYRPSGPPWFYPSVRLAMNTDYFRDSDIELFITRAKLEGGRALDRLQKLDKSQAEVEFRVQAEAESSGGLSPELQLDLMVKNWRTEVGMNMAIPGMVTTYVQSLEAVLQVRSRSAKYLPTVLVSLDLLCYWWRCGSIVHADHEPGSKEGLMAWIRDTNPRVRNMRGELITADGIRKVFLRSYELQSETRLVYERRFGELDALVGA